MNSIDGRPTQHSPSPSESLSGEPRRERAGAIPELGSKRKRRGSLRRRILAGTALLSMLVACGGESEETQQSADLTQGSRVVHTSNGNVAIQRGYNALLDSTASTCVEALASDGITYTVGNINSKSNIEYVASRQSLASELEIDLAMKLKYGPAGGNGAFGMIDSTRFDDKSVHLLINVSRSYVVTNNRDVKLNAVGLAKLNSWDDFLAACGSHYVNRVHFGAQLQVLISYHAADEETARSIKADLGLKSEAGAVTAGLLEFDSSLKSKLQKHAERSNVNAKLTLVANGFTFEDNAAGGSIMASFLGEGVDETTFEKIAAIEQQMEKSIAADSCMDGPPTECADAGQAPGYRNNGRRQANVVAVDALIYDNLPNARMGDAREVTAFQEIRERLESVERYLVDYGELEERMRGVHVNEIGPFLKADSATKAQFQLAAPSTSAESTKYQSLKSPEELVAIATKWDGEFEPLIGSSIGKMMASVTERTADCWNDAISNKFQRCRSDAEETEAEWSRIREALTEYQNAGRVLPLRYKVGDVVMHRNAVEECTDLSTAEMQYRLPTPVEAQMLAPLIGYGTVEWDSSLVWKPTPNEIWISDPAAPSECKPYYRNAPGAKADDYNHLQCENGVHPRTVICVPSSGPIPNREAP